MNKLVMLGNYSDAEYHSFEKIDRILTGLFQEQFDEIKCSDDFTELEHLDQNTTLLLYPDIWTGKISDTQMAALSEYAKAGKILVIHNGISFQNQEEFVRLVGGKFLRHPQRTNLQLHFTENEITGTDETFTVFEEPYQYEFDAEPPIHVFGWYEYEGTDHPCCWYRRTEAGKLVYLMPGHEAAIFEIPAYQTLIRESMNWLQSL